MRLSETIDKLMEFFDFENNNGEIYTIAINLPNYYLESSFASWKYSDTPGEHFDYESLKKYNLWNQVTYNNSNITEEEHEKTIDKINDGKSGKYIGTEHGMFKDCNSNIEIRTNWQSNQMDYDNLYFCFLYPEDEKLTIVHGRVDNNLELPR